MRLGDVCTKITDGSHNPPQGISQSEYLMLSSKNIYDDEITLDAPRYLSKEDFDAENKRTQISSGDILLTIVGTVGRAAVVSTMEKNICLQRSVAVIKPNREIIDSRFLMYQLQSMRTHLDQEARGVAQKGIYLKQVENLQVIIPSMDEQFRVVKKLDKVSKLIALRKEQLAKLDQLVKSRFIELFGDPETNPNRWSISKLSEFCDLQNGYAFKSDDYLTNSTVLNCRMSNIRPDGGFDADHHPKYLPDMFWEKYKDYRLVDGDVIIAMTDMASDPKILGVPTIVRTNGKKFLLNQRVGKLTFFDNTAINNVYLMFVLSQKHIRQHLVKSAGGSTQINVGKPAVLGVEFFVPPMKLQEQFAAFVEQTDKSKMAIQQSLDKLETLKKSLMQEYFGRGD